jgi:hypothetical protein
MLLILKLTLGPCIVAVATLSARRWGPRVGGFIAGLPLSTGPIYLFLLADQGVDFAEYAAVGVLLGLVGLAVFATTYAFAARWAGWLGAIAIAAPAFLLTSWFVSQFQLNALSAALVGCLALLVAAISIPTTYNGEVKRPVPRWDLALRMAITVALTLSVTGVAARLGPKFSGALGASPIIATVVVVFTHKQLGTLAATAILRSIVLSWFSLVGGFVVIGSMLRPYGVGAALICGLIATLVMAGAVPWVDRRIRGAGKPNCKGPGLRR